MSAYSLLRRRRFSILARKLSARTHVLCAPDRTVRKYTCANDDDDDDEGDDDMDAEALLPSLFTVGGAYAPDGVRAQVPAIRLSRANQGFASRGTLPLTRAHATIQCVAGLALTTLVLEFTNGPSPWRKAVFNMPVVHTDAVYAMSALTPTKRIVGKLMDADQARADFKKAIDAGQRAVLADVTKVDGALDLALGRVGAGETVHVNVQFAGIVEGLGNAFKVGLAVCRIPRFGDGPEQPQRLADSDARLTVTLLLGGLDIKSVRVPGVRETELVVGERCTAQIHSTDVADVFFHVMLNTVPEPLALSAPLPGSQRGHATVCVRRPAMAHAASPVLLELVVDASGSMTDGFARPGRDQRAFTVGLDNIAIVGVFELLNQLRPGEDAVKLITFGATAETAVEAQVIPADEDAFAQLKATVSAAIKANLGGTRIADALAYAQTSRAGATLDNRRHIQVLMTDGQFELPNEAQRCAGLSAHLLRSHGTAVCIIGIGAGVNAGQLKEIVRPVGGLLCAARDETEILPICQHILGILRQTTVLRPAVVVTDEAGGRTTVPQPRAWVDAQLALFRRQMEHPDPPPPPTTLLAAEPVVPHRQPLVVATIDVPTLLASIDPPCLYSGCVTTAALVTPFPPATVVLALDGGGAELVTAVRQVADEDALAAAVRAVVGHALAPSILATTSAMFWSTPFRKVAARLAVDCGIIVQDCTAFLAIEEERADSAGRPASTAAAAAIEGAEDDDWEKSGVHVPAEYARRLRQQAAKLLNPTQVIEVDQQCYIDYLEVSDAHGETAEHGSTGRAR